MAQLSLKSSLIAGGGATSASGNYELTGAVGQADSGQQQLGGGFALDGGFWHSVAGVALGVVTTADDELDSNGTPGAGNSLREAIRDAAPGGEIVFDPSLSGATISLGSGQLLIAKSLTIDASALSDAVAISGDNASRILEIASASTAIIRRLKLMNGSATGSGGGILVSGGDLTAEDCWISDCAASVHGGGIRVDNDSTLSLVRCTLSSNQAATNGGAIDNFGDVIVSHCTFFGNTAGNQGGVCRVAGGDSLTISNSTAVGNSAPSEAGVRSSGTFVLDDSIIDSTQNSTLLGVNLVGSSSLLLAPLGDYGGLTPTMPPLPGSPAIDAAEVGGPATDQRGFVRPNGLLPDIGAVETYALTNLASADGDTIPDILEGPDGPYPHLDPGVNDTAIDTDGDGSTDAEEIANMTDLFDANDFFRILSFTKAAGFDPVTNTVFDVTVSSFAGLEYSFERLPDLGTPVPLGAPLTADGPTLDVQVTLESGRDFVRARRD